MRRVFPILALIVGALLMSGIPARAQTNCAPREVLPPRLAETYGETLRALGLAANNTLVEIYASEETGTWTVVVTRPDGLSCLVASGGDWTPITPVQLPEGDAL